MSSFTTEIFLVTLAVFGVLAVVFLIFRELVCWYWKTNQTVALLTEIRDLLAGQQGTSTARVGSSRPKNKEYYDALELVKPFGRDAVRSFTAAFDTAGDFISPMPIAERVIERVRQQSAGAA